MEIVQASPVQLYEYSIDRIEIGQIKLSVLNIQNGKKYIDYINTNDDIWINDLSNTFHKNFNKFFEFIELVFENKLNANIDTELSDNKLSLNINYEQGFMPINIKLILKEEEQKSNDVIIFQLQQCKNENTSLKNEINDLRKQFLGVDSLKIRVDELTKALNLLGKSLDTKNQFYPGSSSIYFAITDGNDKCITDETFWNNPYKPNCLPVYKVQSIDKEICEYYNYDEGSKSFTIGNCGFARIKQDAHYFTRHLLKKIETDVFKYTLKIFNIKYDYSKNGRDWKKLIEILINHEMKDYSQFFEYFRENIEEDILIKRKMFKSYTDCPLESPLDIIRFCWDIYIVDHIEEILSWDNFKKLNDIKI